MANGPTMGLKPVVHEREDLFSHLPVNVSEEGYDIYDGLSGYFDDNVEYEGEKARMEVSLVDLPPILQIQLQVQLIYFQIVVVIADALTVAGPIQPRNLTALQVSCLRQVWGNDPHRSVPGPC